MLVEIPTTTVGTCPRSRQHDIRGDMEPALPHFTGVKGTIFHQILKDGFQPLENPKFDYEALKKELVITKALEPKLYGYLHRIEENFLYWYNTTTIDLRPESIIGSELKINTYIRALSIYEYYLRADLDLITKTHIIDFKTGRRGYLVQNKRQLGSYRDRALEHEDLVNQSLTGDWSLVNVFLGGKEPKEVEHDVKLIDSKVMPKFYGLLNDDIVYDYRIRTEPDYQAPCRMSFGCVFCDYRCGCRGI